MVFLLLLYFFVDNQGSVTSSDVLLLETPSNDESNKEDNVSLSTYMESKKRGKTPIFDVEEEPTNKIRKTLKTVKTEKE